MLIRIRRLCLRSTSGGPGLFSVQVAYGTSKLKTESRPLDLRIQNYRHMQYAGLNQATRFDLDCIKWLQWDSEWFHSPDLSKYPTPVIGKLLDEPQERLRNLLRRRLAKGMSVPVKP